MTDTSRLSTLDRALMLLLAVLLVLLEAFIVWAVLNDGPGHDDLVERLNQIEAAIVETNCVAFIPPADRTPLALAECRIAEDP